MFLEKYSGKPFDQRKKLVDKIFIFCFAWAFGGGLTDSGRIKIDNFITNEFNPQDFAKGQNSNF